MINKQKSSRETIKKTSSAFSHASQPSRKSQTAKEQVEVMLSEKKPLYDIQLIKIIVF